MTATIKVEDDRQKQEFYEKLTIKYGYNETNFQAEIDENTNFFFLKYQFNYILINSTYLKNL